MLTWSMSGAKAATLTFMIGGEAGAGDGEHPIDPEPGPAEVGGFRTSQSPDAVKSRVGLVSANDGVYPWLFDEGRLPMCYPPARRPLP